MPALRDLLLRAGGWEQASPNPAPALALPEPQPAPQPAPQPRPGPGQVDAYPSLSLTLSGTELHMAPRDYLLRGSPLATSAGQFCLGNLRGSTTVPCAPALTLTFAQP